jgi:hypothetical protein
LIEPPPEYENTEKLHVSFMEHYKPKEVFSKAERAERSYKVSREVEARVDDPVVFHLKTVDLHVLNKSALFF